MIVLTGSLGLSRLMAFEADGVALEIAPSNDRLGGAGRPQASSTAMATASPPPMHSDATPFLPPRA